MTKGRIVSLLILCTLAGLQGWTQVQAHRYGYHPALGAPVKEVQHFRQRLRVYAPWKGLGWQWQWGSARARVGMVGGGSVVIGGLLGTMAWGRKKKRQPPSDGRLRHPPVGHHR